ncbi:MAG: ATP-binding cassette domain-containing protein, partial [bacterium]|nr:ATP-binding cassette domain-containing protein [bacterium]
PRLTALETLRIWARLLGRPSADGDLVPLLEEVDLAERRDTPVVGFSAGMRKRLVLLRTRLERPRLVLLDEPFSALDSAGKHLVETWIEGFRTAGITVVLASHALERSARLCDRALLLDRGQIAWQGPAAEVQDRLGELTWQK